MPGFKEPFSQATVELTFVLVCSPKLGKFVGQLRTTGVVHETVTIGGEASVFNRLLVVTHTNIRI